ncbi:helix-turn-helix domain-containing protein [Paracoccus liaowanqingii]|uniref:Helix-turn-helix domain-containing protein n=1 Tax=Paracoccus liaowanqingii TaxID=2560053 RepID=A0A4V1BJ06_9RHOB|nr:helix-turn-helix domain-containing protein [Paracoccus liaowanqingii]QBX34622.1 helix-turn-helix domain-containing protein [Paracoccus liaowanqingii]
MTVLRILIACETSSVMRRAFAARGHDVWSCDLLPAEDAKQIGDYPLYLVTNLGRVISFQSGAPIVMKPRPHIGGYRIVTLCNRERRTTTTVHRLVAKEFLPNPQGLPLVRHRDGDRSHNSAGNLAWGTYADNEADKIEHGTRRYGTSRMKLNRAARAEVLEMHRMGVTRREIAEVFGVDRSTVTRLVNGTTWSNRKWPIADGAAQR